MLNNNSKFTTRPKIKDFVCPMACVPENSKLWKFKHYTYLLFPISIFCLLCFIFFFSGCSKKFTIPPLVETTSTLGNPKITSITSNPEDRISSDPSPTSKNETLTIIVCGYDTDSYLSANTAFSFKMYDSTSKDISKNTFGSTTYSNSICSLGFQVPWTAPATLGDYSFEVKLTDEKGNYDILTKLVKVE